MGVILPGVDGTGRDFPPVFSWDWDGMGLIFVGVGRERFENSLPCHPLMCGNIRNMKCTVIGQARFHFTCNTFV